MKKNNISEFNRQELIDFFSNEYPKVNKQYTVIMELLDVTKRIKDNEKSRSSAKTGFKIMVIVFFIFTVMINAVAWGYLDTYVIKIGLLIFSILLSLFFIAVVFIPVTISIKSEQRNLNERNEELKNALIILRKENPDLNIIPFKYQTPVAITEMKEYLKHYRANNWTEAVNLLEDTIYKNRMLYQQSQQNAMLNQQMEQLRKIQSSMNLPSFGIMIGL